MDDSETKCSVHKANIPIAKYKNVLLIKRLMMVLDLLNLQNVNVQDFEQKASNISAGSQGSRVH